MNELKDKIGDIDPFQDQEENSSAKPGLQMARLRMALARWWVILVFAVLGYVIALYTLSIAEPMHSARAAIEVVGRKRQLVGTGLEQGGLSSTVVQTMCLKMLGSSQMTKVVNNPKIQTIEKAIAPQFSMKPKYWRTEEELRFKSAAEASTSELAGMVQGRLRVMPRAGTNLIDVSVSHMDSQTAQTIADVIVEEFLAAEEERKDTSRDKAYKIMRGDAADAEADLETAQRALSAYNGVMGTKQALGAASAEMTTLKLRYKEKHPKMIVQMATLNRLQESLFQQAKAVIQIPSEVEFWSMYKLDMDKLETAMETARAELANITQDDRVNIKDLQGEDREKAETASKELAEAQGRWMRIVQDALMARTGALQADIAHKRSHYNRVVQRITDIGVEERNEEYDLRVAEKAFPSGNVEVDKYKRLGQGVAGGALAGFAIAYLLAMLDFKIYDVRTVEEATGMPCLAAVPESAVFDIEENWQNVLDADHRSANAEAIRNLRASIMLLGKAERNKSILITSAAPGEGKTTIASELAAAFAMNEQKTILVDLDLRKPRVHTLFPGVNETLGISEVLSGQADLATVVQRTNIPGLHVICSGTKPPNPSELLQANEIEDVINKLGEYYDRIIIDSPPVLPVSDTRLIAQHVQTTLLVVRALKVPVGAIMRTRELLEQARVNVAGVVINSMKRKHIGSGYYGYRGYGEYGGYGGYGGYYDDDDE